MVNTLFLKAYAHIGGMGIVKNCIYSHAMEKIKNVPTIENG